MFAKQVNSIFNNIMLNSFYANGNVKQIICFVKSDFVNFIFHKNKYKHYLNILNKINCPIELQKNIVFIDDDLLQCCDDYISSQKFIICM